MDKIVDGVTVKMTDVEEAQHRAVLQEMRSESELQKIETLRMRRNYLLEQSDWTQMPDITLTVSEKELWATYRQSLRDIPQQAGFPSNVVWPIKPK